MEKRLTADLNVVANSNLEIQLLDGDLNIIQKLDDEPNDVGGLTSAELKAKFDESGNIIKKYINETLIPAVLTDDATEESRKQAEAARVAAEQGRVTAEEGRVSAETAREQAETARQSAETARSGAESIRQSKETARQTAETARANAETDRQAAETRRGEAETARAFAESERRNAESSRVTAEGGRTSAEASRVTAEQGRTSAESTRVQDEQKRVSAENSRVEAEAQRAAAEQARADENTGIVAQATAQANAAAQSAGIASASAQTAQSAASSAGTAASTASSAAASASGSASQAQASAAAAAQNAASVAGINKTAESWAVGGTGTRPGEDTDNAKYWAEQAQAVVGGDFATKVEAQGYVTTHNQSADAHSDIRNALNGKEASGTAAAAVTAHNKDSAAHADIREALAGKEAAGAAATVQSNLTAHAGNTTVHVTSKEKTAWNGKAEGKHASQHGKDGADPITPTAIGAATVDHNHYGLVIQPTSIELFPGTSAGHGGYIDFHFNSDAADYTSRIYEPVKGVLKYNGHGILSTANIVALLNVDITFTNGVATYKNSAIKGSSVTFVQWRAGAVSTLTDSVLSTTPQNGSMIIVAKAGFTGGPLPVNILIINR